MQTHKLLSKTLYLLFMLQFSTVLFAQTNESLSIGDLKGDGPWIVLAHYQDKDEVLALKPFYDLWRLDEKNRTVLMVVEHRADYQELIKRGFSLSFDKKLMKQQAYLQQKSLTGIKTITNFPCYRTVAETFDVMDDMSANYPNLVTLVDIGDSWEKTQNSNQGHDMQVVKLTNSGVIDPNKPVLYAMGSIHSREYPPAELVTRFAEYLLSEYGNNADVTWLLDYHEIHLLLQGNPDGRIISEGESSAFQRKNYNANHCPGGGGFGDMQGVDMNRNFEFLWNQGSGSSGTQCNQSYRGTTPVSEPETAAINNYIQSIFADQRADDLVTPAPDNTTGVYLDIHNVAELTLFPWGYDSPGATGQAPNHQQLQTLARRMSYFTGYRAEQSNSTLGGADGASDDNAYGTLGVAAYTIELGEGGFYSSCSAFDNTIWPDNLPALIYAAKASRTPYISASGPDVIDLPQQPIQVVAGQMIDVSGTATDLRFNNSNGTEPTQNITAIKAYLATPSWASGAVAIDMAAVDGDFDSKSEGFIGSLDSTALADGRYTLWFEATDAAGVTGVPTAVFVDVVDSGNLGTVTGVVRDANSNALIEQAAVSYAGIIDMTDVNGVYSIQTSATSSDLSVNKLGYIEQTIAGLTTTGGQTTTQNILLEPSCDLEVLNVDVEAFADINQAISAGWSLVTGSGSNDWRVATGDNHTPGGSNAFVSTDVSSVSDKSLVTPVLSLAPDAELVFWHKHDFESNNDDYDGGVIEISTDGGVNWVDLGSRITQNGYNGTLSTQFANPLGGRQAFVDNLGTFTEVKVDLSDFASQNVQLRWRMGTDNSTSAGDWKLDDIRVFAAQVCKDPSDLIFADGFEAF